MTRDELLLAALAAGEGTTAGLMRSTGVTERSCRYGLDRLVAAGYAWSPARGLWRLTEQGRAIASEVPRLPAADQPAGPSDARPSVESRTAPTDETAAPSSSAEDPAGGRASLWWGLAGIAVAVVLALARRQSISPPLGPPSAPPDVWPYDGWRI